MIFAFLYFLLAAIFTYPLILRFQTSIYGYPSDSFATIWRFWSWTQGAAIGDYIGPYLLHFCGKWLATVTNEIAAYNLLLFLSFPLAALTMYLLVWELTRNKYASFISGLIYSFSLYHFWHGFAHLGLSQIQWLPLYIWSLIKLDRRRNIRWSLLTALIYLLNFLTDYYYGYFLLLFTAAFVFGQIVLKKFDWKLLGCYLLTAVLVILLVTPFALKARQSQEFLPVSKRSFDDLLALSARPWDYFLPSIYHPVWGRWVEPIYQTIESWGNDFEYRSAFLPERPIYLGLTAVALAVFGFIHGLKTRHRDRVVLFGICSGLLLWASGPAFVSLRGLNIPFPSFFLYHIFPMFRAYIRLGLLVLLGVAVLAGFGVKFLLEGLKAKRLLPIAYCLVPFLILFEVLNFPPFHSTDFSQIPEVYRWLATEPGNFIIAEYPRDNDVSSDCRKTATPVARNYGYGKFFQRTHGKDLFDSSGLDAEVRAKLADPTDPEALKVLSIAAVKYIVVHTKEIFPGENPLDSCHGWAVMAQLPDGIPGLKLVREFPEAIVYEVLPQ